MIPCDIWKPPYPVFANSSWELYGIPTFPYVLWWINCSISYLWQFREVFGAAEAGPTFLDLTQVLVSLLDNQEEAVPGWAKEMGRLTRAYIDILIDYIVNIMHNIHIYIHCIYIYTLYIYIYFTLHTYIYIYTLHIYIYIHMYVLYTYIYIIVYVVCVSIYI